MSSHIGILALLGTGFCEDLFPQLLIIVLEYRLSIAVPHVTGELFQAKMIPDSSHRTTNRPFGAGTQRMFYVPTILAFVPTGRFVVLTTINANIAFLVGLVVQLALAAVGLRSHLVGGDGELLDVWLCEELELKSSRTAYARLRPYQNIAQFKCLVSPVLKVYHPITLAATSCA